MEFKDVRQHYSRHEGEIQERMGNFRRLRDSSDERWFREMAFVVLSSQTDAHEAWDAAGKLEEMDALDGSPEEIFDVVKRFEIQYASRKSEQIAEARQELSQPSLKDPSGDLKIQRRLNLEDQEKARRWIYENIPGLGLKGSSHFLRNIGYGGSLGIASRHTISVLKDLGATEMTKPPSSIEEYRSLEEDMEKIGEELGLATGAVDLVLWSMETGEVFR